MGERQSAVESLAVTPEFWRGKRVFLTGHTGFKGSWMSLWLQSLGAQVSGYALAPPERASLFQIAKVESGMHSVIGDVRDLTKLLDAMRHTQPQIVIHLAAQALVRDSYKNPVETYATNLMGTVHLLEAVRQTSSVAAVVCVTTDKCYENREWLWGYRENEPMGGYDPYSSSKGCAELAVAAYRSSYFSANTYSIHGVAVATARAGNVIGGGDWAEHRLLPDVVAAFEADRPAQIRNPNAVRPWQHVLEALRGYLVLAENLHKSGSAYAEPWNFGPNDEDAKPVAWIVEQMAEIWGSGASWQIDTRDHAHEANYLKLDISKARSRLNWHPKMNLKQALELIVNWSQAKLNAGDMQLYTLDQIRTYQALASK